MASTIAIGAGPAGAQPCAYLTTSGTVYVVDTSTHKVVTTVPVLVSRPALAISRTGERAYVTGAASGSDGGGRMYVLDTTENRVLYDVRIRYSSMGTDVEVLDLALSLDERSAYLAFKNTLNKNTLGILATRQSDGPTGVDSDLLTYGDVELSGLGGCGAGAGASAEVRGPGNARPRSGGGWTAKRRRNLEPGKMVAVASSCSHRALAASVRCGELSAWSVTRNSLSVTSRSAAA